MTPDHIQSLHQTYCQASGRQVVRDLAGGADHLWHEWAKHGFTSQDLLIVIGYIQEGIRTGKRNPGALKFRTLLGDPLAFSDELAEAKAHLRQKTPYNPRQGVLKASGRADQTKEMPKVSTPGEILAGLKAREDFIRLGKSL